jgi:nucleotide-binding universal stress UspA family protein
MSGVTAQNGVVDAATVAPPVFPRAVVVPLDGSPLARLALAPAQALAGRIGAELVLVHVTTPDPGTAPPDREASAVPVWLQEEKNALRRAERQARHMVVTGEPTQADGIVAAVTQTGAELIVMATHSRTGRQRALVGGVADGLVRSSPVPILLVPPRPGSRVSTGIGGRQPVADDGATVPCRLLVPLDGSPAAEAAVAPAARLARALGAEIGLLRVVPETYLLLGPDRGAQSTMPAAAYLARVASGLDAIGVDRRWVRTIVRVADRERIAETLLDEATRDRASMLVLAADARPGSDLLFGRVAAAAIAAATLPLLVVRATATAQRSEDYLRPEVAAAPFADRSSRPA